VIACGLFWHQGAHQPKGADSRVRKTLDTTRSRSQNGVGRKRPTILAGGLTGVLHAENRSGLGRGHHLVDPPAEARHLRQPGAVAI